MAKVLLIQLVFMVFLLWSVGTDPAFGMRTATVVWLFYVFGVFVGVILSKCRIKEITN